MKSKSRKEARARESSRRDESTNLVSSFADFFLSRVNQATKSTITKQTTWRSSVTRDYQPFSLK